MSLSKAPSLIHVRFQNIAILLRWRPRHALRLTRSVQERFFMQISTYADSLLMILLSYSISDIYLLSIY